MKEEDEIPPSMIEQVLIIPKNPRTCRYWLNGSEDAHVKKREDLVAFLSGLCPSLSRDISIHVHNFYQSFLLIIHPQPEIILFKPSRDVSSASERVGDRITPKGLRMAQNESRKALDKDFNLFAPEVGRGAFLLDRKGLYSKAKRLKADNPLPKWGE